MIGNVISFLLGGFATFVVNFSIKTFKDTRKNSCNCIGSNNVILQGVNKKEE